MVATSPQWLNLVFSAKGVACKTRLSLVFSAKGVACKISLNLVFSAKDVACETRLNLVATFSKDVQVINTPCFHKITRTGVENVSDSSS